LIVVWFREDLRLSDNPALFEAAKHSTVLPIYIWDDSDVRMGAASKWWLHHSLEALNQSLDGKLNVYAGKPKEVISQLVKSYPVTGVYWNRSYTPFGISQDEDIASIVIVSRSFNGSLLWEPSEVLKDDGTYYKVYTAFYNKLNSIDAPRSPLPIPSRLDLMRDLKNNTTIKDFSLLPDKHWYLKLEKDWEIGEIAAQKRLRDFLANDLSGYKSKRDYPAELTSRLSPHLHFGEVSPNQVWYGASAHAYAEGRSKDHEWFLRELCWREFSYYLLHHFPNLPGKDFNNNLTGLEWDNNQDLLKLWQQGKTGYPLIDAGMRELWQTGYMHNRVRMVVASFLIKNLLIDWRIGADWFWDCLVDADLASNSMNWQWVAGCGPDAAPYFRIFNPTLQGEKFDPEGEYTKRFVPELSKLPKKFLFEPWKATDDVLRAAGIRLGIDYPAPIIDLGESRKRALSMARNLKAT
jgi:deoxyribodipyrimidine photo-lyase